MLNYKFNLLNRILMLSINRLHINKDKDTVNLYLDLANLSTTVIILYKLKSFFLGKC